MNTKYYRLPHNEFRQYQEETIEWARDTKLFVPKITEQSTGSGKTAIAMAQSIDGQIIAITKTKSLQNQYQFGGYGCVALYGKGNYTCGHRLAPVDATAEDCIYVNDLRNCYLYDQDRCKYYLEKQRAVAGSRVALNYALWFMIARRVFEADERAETFRPNYLVMDEAHTISDLVLNFVGIEFNEKQREKFNLPEFPMVRRKSAFVGMKNENSYRVDSIVEWIHNSLDVVGKERGDLEELKIRNEKEVARLKQLRSLDLKLNCSLESLIERPGEHWFIRSGSVQDNGFPGLICKPITARYDAVAFFKHPRTMYMSATIGNVAAFAEELGITEYDARVIPSAWGKEQKPVQILPCDSMGKSATEKNELAFEKQADIIANAIKACPSSWSGFVLVTRKSEARLLAERLARRGLQNRVWVTPGYDGDYAPTDAQINAWRTRMKSVKNTICVSWSFWEGVDGVDQKICIVGKIPFVQESEYEQARREYDGKFYLQRAAYILEQGLGRTRRGNDCDYDYPEDDVMNGFVAIADGSWKRVRSYLSKSLQESIVE